MILRTSKFGGEAQDDMTPLKSIYIRLATAACTFSALISVSSPASTQDFTAKTVNLVVGFPPGGGYDTYARILSRHYARHLPGNPSVVVQNMPGGGSLNLANTTANTAPADGSHLAFINSAAALEPVLGNPQARFKTSDLVFIGNMIKDGVGCAAWHTSGVRTWDDAIKKNAKFGGVGAAGTSSQHAYFLKKVLDAPITIITGYRGTNEINLGMQRGEVDVSCGLFVSSMRGAYRQDYEAGNLNMILQFGKQNEPYFKGATNIYSLLTSPEDHILTGFVFGQAEITRPLVAPPALPPSIQATLRSAFDKTMRDAEFLADAQRAQIDINPATGAETAAEFAHYMAVSTAIAARAKTVLQP
jgi:tripartite-type tricarboxylate transporter receptor subunit TctC